MASLQDSLRMKAANTKAPSVTGQQRLQTPDTPLDEGKSGGISASKARKNAASTPNNVGPKHEQFIDRIGGGTQSDKTVGYF